MDYDLFETYVILCETGSITKAAALLHRTQPAITARIQQLENELGCTLVHREKGRKTITLTPRGETFLQTAREFVALYHEIDKTRSALSNSITISTIGSLSATIVPDICNRIIARYGTQMSLLVYQSIEAYQMVANKQLDLAFVSTATEVPGVTCEALFQLDYVVVQAREHPKDPILTSVTRFDPRLEIYQRWNPAFDGWHLSRFGAQNYLIRVDSCHIMKRFLHQPGSWAFIQRSNLPEITSDMSVQIYELLDPPPTRTCYLISNSLPDHLNARAIQQFKDEAYAYSEEMGLLPIIMDANM